MANCDIACCVIGLCFYEMLAYGDLSRLMTGVGHRAAL